MSADAFSGLRISIVTPCLNQGDTIEAAMRSVLDQADAGVEYIVVDGGSTDGTLDVIKRYADKLAWWVSEPDRGQSQALNKGFAHATGDVICWLNADDLLMPGVIAKVRAEFERSDCDLLCGSCRYEYSNGETVTRPVTQREVEHLDVYDPIHQPSCFWRRQLHVQVGGLDERLTYGMDWDLWLRLVEEGARVHIIDDVLSVYRISGTNTTLWPLKRMRRRSPGWFFRPVSNTARTTLLMALGPIFGFRRVRRCTHPFS